MNTAYRLTAIVVFIGAFNTLSRGAAPSSQPATALEAAKQYAQLLTSNKPIDAIEKFWDFDRIFATIFGDEMNKVSNADRDQMRHTMILFLGQAYETPDIANALATAKVQDFTVKTAEKGRQTVSFNLVTTSGKVLPNVLVFEQNDGRFGIVDGGAAGKTMGTAHNAYIEIHDQISPPDFLKTMASTVIVPGSAVDVAKHYTNLFKAGKAAEAIETYWDLDAMFVFIFGDDMKKVPDADVAKMKTEMLVFLKGIYADPKEVTSQMADRYLDIAEQDAQGIQRKVTFNIVSPQNTYFTFTLVLEQRDGRFKIVDSLKENTSTADNLRDFYNTYRKNHTPLQVLQVFNQNLSK